jgi:outer membrane protein assembly factor BamB
MSTPGRYNYFELSFKIIVTMMVLAISITVFVLKVNDAQHSHPIVKHTASKSALWEKAGFYIWDNDRENGQQIVALNNRMILNNDSKVVALDGQTGKELWTYSGGSVDGFAISPTTVFVGNAGYVTALDVETGNVLWSTRMPHGKGAITLHIQGDTLYAGDGSLLYELLNTQTGEVLEWGFFRDGKFPPSEVFPARELYLTDSLMGIHKVVGNTVYWGNEESVGARDILSGNILWRYQTPLISPIAVMRDSIYAISENGKLMHFDTATGAASVMISYTPTPLARLTKDEADLYNNFVAVDPTSNIVYVYLGDSETLMAYQLKP